MVERELRLQEEYKLIVSVFPDVIRQEDWFLIPDDARAVWHGWTPDPFPIAFQAQPGHPVQVPYGIYVASSVQVCGKTPHNFTAEASNRPPFEGEWGVLSWQGDSDGIPWVPTREIRAGANLLNFVMTFEERFKGGV